MRKYLSILLSFVLLASHFYLTIGTHFCGGESVQLKILLGKKHLDCEMPNIDNSCAGFEKNSTQEFCFDELPCCENEYQLVHLTNEFVISTAQTDFNVEFAVAFIFTGFKLDLFPKSTHQFYTEYISPPFEKDIQVLFQTFLI